MENGADESAKFFDEALLKAIALILSPYSSLPSFLQHLQKGSNERGNLILQKNAKCVLRISWNLDLITIAPVTRSANKKPEKTVPRPASCECSSV